MQSTRFAALFSFVAILGLAGCCCNQPAQESKSAAAPAAPTGEPDMQLPPGWTPQDMQAYADAATPGPMHAHLTQGVGTWTGTSTSWMAPGTEGTKSTTKSVVTSVMDGKFVQVDVSGDMLGMGPFHGMGLNGYDNVTKKFISSWIDNMGTTMMTGTGELSPNGKSLTWTYTYSCPINKRPTIMREVETSTGPNSMTLEMFGADPKTGVEYKMMQIDMTRK